MKLLLILCILFKVLATCLCYNIGYNWCRETRSTARARSVSYSQRYDSYTKCGWWNCCRCHRNKYRTRYRLEYYTAYYSYDQCCSRYTLHNGRFCKRALLGFEKTLYYLEKNNTVRICAKKYVNDVANDIDRESHILAYRVVLNGRTVANGDISLSRYQTRNCDVVVIGSEYRTSGDLRAYLSKSHVPNYVSLRTTSATIRPRQDIIIGFEETQMSVYEDAGNIRMCYGIRSPQNLRPTEFKYFYFSIVLRNGTGHHNLDFGHTNSNKYVTKYYRKRCSSAAIISDHIHEGSESFSLELVGHNVPDYIIFDPSTISIEIINERRNLTIGFDVRRLKVLESAGSETICIGTSNDTTYLYNGLTLEVMIPSAYDKDIALSNSIVRFDGATIRQCLSLNITDDSDLEGNEEIVLTLEVNSTTQPFYMEVNPSFMILTILDDDSVVIGFDSSVMEVQHGSPIRVCAHIHSEPSFPVNRDISVRVTSQDLTADSRHYYFPGGIFSTGFSENCYTGSTLRFTTSNQPRTFLVTMTPTRYYREVIFNPQTILVKITYNEASLCESGSYHHEEVACSGSCNWENSNTTILVSDDVCLTKKAVKKYRDSRPHCTNEGLLCTESVEEKIIGSFNLGIAPQVSNPEATTGACNATQTRLDCTSSMDPITSAEVCQPDQPSVCSSRSILFVLDTSNSIGQENFKLTTEAMSELTLHFCGDVQVAVAKFNKHAHLDLCFNCLTKSRFDLARFIRNNIEYGHDGAGHTNFRSSARCILNKAFNMECGSHTHSDCVDIVYITDGEDVGDACAQPWFPLQDNICNKSRALVIGVGRHVNVTQLYCIASPATEGAETVFQFDTFTDLQKHVAKSVQYLYKKRKICNSRSTGSICDRNRIDLACRG